MGPATPQPSFDRGRFLPGAILADRYRIVGLLGRGGMGEVYRADDLKLGQQVALKFLPEEVQRHPERLERFLNEARVALLVSHPNVCRVYDIGEVDGQHYISMEYVDGEDLSSLLRRIGRLPQDKALQVARQICAGLAVAHEQGIVHRDLKPANVMIDGRGRAKITDFGLARIAESIVGDEARAGTPAYMAPEQLAGTEATIRSDVYALGLVLYELFTGRRAFDAASSDRSTPTSLSSHVDGLDPAVERAILRCLAPEPAKRPASVLAVSAALPGGDPLAAALAAGETPSPEMVAAAGTSEAMTIRSAVVYGLLIAASLAGLIALSSSIAIYSYVPLDKAPEALKDRAEEVLDRLGYGSAPADTAHGYGRETAVHGWIERTDPSPDRWQRLGQPRSHGMFFWYRESPRPFRPASSLFGSLRVLADQPPWNVPGETYVSLDMAGKLRRFYVIPGGTLDPAASGPESSPDWRVLFDLAGLDIERFVPVEPRLLISFRVDERFAWSGTFPEAPDLPVQIEAAVLDGKVAYFRPIAPWDEPAPPPPDSEPSAWVAVARFIERWDQELADGLRILVAVIALVIAFRRRHQLRGEKQWAFRVAVFVGTVVLLGGLFSGRGVLPTTTEELLRVLALSVFLAVTAWICYLALEPYVRRLWPTMLIAWTRLVSGRVLDPLVGKSIVVGILFGLAIAATRVLAVAIPGWQGDPIWPIWNSFEDALAVHYTLSRVGQSLAQSVFEGFFRLLLLVMLRFVLGRQWLAAVVFVPVAALLVGGDFLILPWGSIAAIAGAILTWVVLQRFGVLAASASICADRMLVWIPLTTDLSAWYVHAMLIPVGLVVALAVYGLVAATRERSGQRPASV